MDIRDDWAETTRRMHAARALGVLLSLEDALIGPSEKLSQAGREKLESLAALDRVSMAIHSCRRLQDLVEEVRVPGVWYVANRGFELRDPQGKETQFFGPEDVRVLDRVHDELLVQAGHVVGVRLIHRGACLVLNYEEVDPPQVPLVLDIFRNILGTYAPQLVAVHSRRTIEARIRSAFDEKTALRYVHRRLVPGTLFFYFGVDPALLQMFAEFRPLDILVEVGPSQASSAKYSLPGSSDVVEVLGRIVSQWGL